MTVQFGLEGAMPAHTLHLVPEVLLHQDFPSPLEGSNLWMTLKVDGPLLPALEWPVRLGF